LGAHGVPHTVIADNAGGHLMQHGEVDIVIVGTDRVTRRGDGWGLPNFCQLRCLYLSAEALPIGITASTSPHYRWAASCCVHWGWCGTPSPTRKPCGQFL
jgi:hypothetical protein